MPAPALVDRRIARNVLLSTDIIFVPRPNVLKRTLLQFSSATLDASSMATYLSDKARNL